MIQTVGSVCSGIEVATVAWEPFGVRFDWFSEIAAFPSRLLAEKYPTTPNLGDMNNIPELLLQKENQSIGSYLRRNALPRFLPCRLAKRLKRRSGKPYLKVC